MSLPAAAPVCMALLVGLLTACGDAPSTEGGRERPAPERVLLVTTTTVEASGLLEALVEAYHAAQDEYRLVVTAVGSGAALELGRRGDADLLVTHDPIGEAAFMRDGLGTAQGPLMRNEFVLVGPPADPAAIAGLTDLAAAFERIAEAGARFISRGDDSGTHRRERQLWSRVALAPWERRPSWYIESGSGMDETLRIAEQRDAYTLSGSATFRNLRDGLDLTLLARGNPPEVNAYQWTLPRDPRNPDGARHLRDWLLGPGQDVIARYGVERFGEALFMPMAPGASGDSVAARGAAGGLVAAAPAAAPRTAAAR